MPPEIEAPTLEDIDNGTIEDDLRASFAEVIKETPQEPAGEPESVPEQAATEEPESQEKPAGERERDEKGRFVAKEGELPESEPEPVVETTPETPGTPESADPVEPPVEWTLEEQEGFRALPPAQQKFVLDRVGASAERIAEAEKTTARYSALDGVLAPYREKWARDGFEDVSVVRQLLALTDHARNNPEQFIKEFAQGKGIDLSRLGQAPAETPAVDPNSPYAEDPVVQLVSQQLDAVRKELAASQQEIRRLNGTFQTREQQEQQQSHQRLKAEVDSFAEARDEKGNAKHPYFPVVRSHMSALMGQGLASTLEEAYDQACHANPDVRAKIAAAAKAASERERARQQREKADAARKAGSSVSGSPVTTRSEPQSTGDVFEDLRQGFAAASGASQI